MTGTPEQFRSCLIMDLSTVMKVCGNVFADSGPPKSNSSQVKCTLTSILDTAWSGLYPRAYTQGKVLEACILKVIPETCGLVHEEKLA